MFDLVIRGGTIVTGGRYVVGDIGVKDGVIAAMDVTGLAPGMREIDAHDKLVMPGGIDSHCHVEQESSFGIMCADDFYSATVSAAFGGTTTIIPFAAQHRGQSLREVVKTYHARAAPKAVVDYAFHLIVSDPTEQVLGQELPALIQDGYTSFKVYMTYDKLRLADTQILDVLALARREGALVMIHAENHDMIQWLAKRLMEANQIAPTSHAISHARVAESEATYRAIALAELIDVPLLIVHVSSAEAIDVIRQAQQRGLRIYGETCPQYLFLTADDIDRPGLEGAKFCCSPPPRDATAQEAVWQGLKSGVFQVFSSDHAPYRFDKSGKLPHGLQTTFKEIANGVPGLEVRLPLLFSEGVGKRGLTVHEFVELTATNHAKMYGLYPKKGTIQIGADADLAIWDPDRKVTISSSILHDRVGYTPYEGREVKGWPIVVISRGRVVVEHGELNAMPGTGHFLPCAKPASANPRRRLLPEIARFGAISGKPLF